MSEVRLPAVVDHRPTWLVQSQHLLENTKEKHRNATEKLKGLFKTASELSEKISVESLLANSNNDIGEDSIEGNPWTKKESFLPWIRLPTDIYGKLCGFLLLGEIVNMEMTSKSIKNLSMDSFHWLTMIPSGVNHSGTHKDARNLVLNKARIEYKCMKFVKDMKVSRSVPRNNTIKPRRYSKMEQSVTHPLPIFENNTSEKIMSSTDTLDTDIRCETLSALSDMSILTSNELDVFSDTLTAEGVVTVSECLYISLNYLIISLFVCFFLTCCRF